MKWKICLVLLNITRVLLAQLNCNNFDASTFESTINSWDWRNDTLPWNVFIENEDSSISSYGVWSPFRSGMGNVNQLNTKHLYTQITDLDYAPEEGWELIAYNFGSPTAGVKSPYLILYNRHRGNLRIFLASSHNFDNLPYIFLETSFSKENSQYSGLFESSKNIMNALDAFEQGVRVLTPNERAWGSSNTFYWLYSDLFVNYDPCICNSNSSISIDDLPVVDINVQRSAFGTSMFSGDIFGRYNELIRFNSTLRGSPMFNNILLENNELTDFYGTTKSTQILTSHSASGRLFYTKNNLINNQLRSLKSDSIFLANSNIRLPYALLDGSVIEQAQYGLDNFVSGGRSIDYGNSISQITTKGNFNEHTFQNFINEESVSFYLPGFHNYDLENIDSLKVPIYKHNLGVFSLLETPVLEKIEYGAENLFVGNKVMPKITQYRLKNPLKYAINPASELEIVDMKVALEYQLLPRVKNKHPKLENLEFGKPILFEGVLTGSGQKSTFQIPFVGPVFSRENSDNSSFETMLQRSGVLISNWPKHNNFEQFGFTDSSLYNMTFSTGYFNPACHENYSFALADYNFDLNTNVSYLVNNCGGLNAFRFDSRAKSLFNQLNFSNENLSVVLKVRLILRRTDQFATDETEDIIIVQSYNVNIEENKTGKIGKYSLSKPCSWSDNSSLFGRDYYVKNFEAPDNQLPFNNFSDETENVFVCNDFLPPVDEEYIQGFCNTRYRRIANKSIISDLNLSVSNLIIFPNPVKDIVNFEFDLDRDSNVSIKVFNYLGAEVLDTKIYNLEAGKISLEKSVNELTNGIYFLSVCNSINCVTESILIVK